MTIDSTEADAAGLTDAITRASFKPVAVEAAVERVAEKAAPARGGCCGG